ncbi:hypothetical protein CORC01_10410, partial [Colletotrichum orchidophilum]
TSFFHIEVKRAGKAGFGLTQHTGIRRVSPAPDGFHRHPDTNQRKAKKRKRANRVRNKSDPAVTVCH